MTKDFFGTKLKALLDATLSGQRFSFSKTQGGADACPGLLDVAPSGLNLAALMAAGILLTGSMGHAAEPAAAPEKAVSTPVSGRPQVPLAGEWKVQYVQEPGAAPGETWEAKPVVMPKTIAMPGTLDPQKPTDYKYGTWLERAIEIPADWQGRHTVLKVGRCLYGVGVYVDGRKAGEIPGYGGELDVTSLVTPGKAATLRLYCGRLGKGLETMDLLAKCAADYNYQKDPGGSYLCGPVGVFGLPEEFCMESHAPDICVQDVWYQTVVRGGARIDPIIQLWSATDRDGLSCRVRIYEPNSDKPVLEKTVPLGHLPAGASKQHLVLPAGTLKLWGILQPNLYFGQAEILDADGKQLDRTDPVRFGIREFWAQGRQMWLNDRPVYPVPGFAYQPKDLDPLVAEGVTMVQREFPYWFKFFNEDFRGLAAACDERGILLMASGMTHMELPLGDPDVLGDYRVWAERYYGRYENHPSIVMYGLGINAPGNFNDFSPTKFGRTSNMDWSQTGTTRSYLISREIDPTRLYYFHGGPRGGDVGSANFYPNHMPVQEVEDWMLEWSEKGDRPFMTFEGLLGTLEVDYEKPAWSFGSVYVTEYAARLIGDGAYAAENDDYRTYSTYKYSRATEAMNGFWSLDPNHHPAIDSLRGTALMRGGRAWRYLGIPFNHWAGIIGTGGGGAPVKTAFQRAGQDLRKPVMAWIGGTEKEFSLKDHNFYSGQTVEKTLLGIYDRQDVATWAAQWELKDRKSGATVASGQISQKMSPFTRAKIPFSFKLPEVKEMTDFDLTLAVQDAATNEPVATDSFALSVYPRPAAEPAAKSEVPFYTFDPEGETAAWLKSLGVTSESWKPGSPVAGRVLVIGRRALRGLKELPYTLKDVEGGLRVVIFEQKCAELDKIGFRHEDRSPRQMFIRQAEHPLAANLTAEALRDWQGHATLISEGPEGDRLAVSTRSFRTSNRGSVASDVIETPHFGPFMTVVDGEFDLSYTPLMSWRHGQGEIVFCQLDLVGRVGKEPGADLVAANLVKYLKSPLPGRTEKIAVCLDEATVKTVEGFGFEAKVSSGKLSPKDQVLVITGAQAPLLEAKREAVAAFLKDGGEVLALYANEQLLADPIFGGRLKAEPVRVNTNLVAMQAHPLLKGAGPQNLHWRVPVDLVKVTSEDKDYVPLLDGLAGVLPVGKGRIVLFQADPKLMADATAENELDPMVKEIDPKTKLAKYKPLTERAIKRDRTRTKWQVNRLHSLVLANLGLRSSGALAQRLFEVKPTMQTVPVNEWMLMGPLPPIGNPDRDGLDPLERKDLAEFAAQRDPAFVGTTAQGAKVKWITPSDCNNGMGLDGKTELSKIMGVKIGQAAIAVNYIWSTRAREAVIGIGADWWLQVNINGQKVFRTTDKVGGGFDTNFGRKVKVSLKAGWNEVVCYVCAGSGSHIFWFEITNPGDVVVAQQLTAPTAPPAGLPPAEDLLPDNVAPGFSLYTEPMSTEMDPYSYIPW